MEKEKISELIARYNAGMTTPSEQEQIELLIGKGSIQIEELNDLRSLDERLEMMETPDPSSSLDNKFYSMLSLEKKPRSSFSWKSFFSWPDLAPKLAFASITLIIGVFVGYMIKPSTQQPTAEVNDVYKEVRELKEMMMLSLLEKESATDRLKAVSLTQEMDQASQKVTKALIETLNNDSNINVRLAALDALESYSKDPSVREALVRSIAHQESPLVQVALAELMAGLQVKSSVKELQKILENKNTPKDVKDKIKKSIDVLI